MDNTILRPKVQKFIDEISKKYCPGFSVKSKSKPDWKMKFVSFIVGIFNSNIDEGFTTTIFDTIWVPDTFKLRTEKGQLSTIIHETIHVYDAHKYTNIVFGFVYLCPQILSILALLAVFGGWWLWFLLFLICILPIPSFGRKWAELRGYRSNIMFDRYVDKCGDTELLRISKMYSTCFTGNSYYFMWPFKNNVVSGLLDRNFEKEEIYVEIIDWLKHNGLIT